MEPLDVQEIADFLIVANHATWANKNAAKVSSSRLKSEDYHFEQGNLIYHDTYFGGKDFIGGEIVYKDEMPIWGMNYYGYILSSTADVGTVYGFLRKALMQEFSNLPPVRGPKEFREGEWKYTNTIQGGLDRFTGTEAMYQNDQLVYRADYHGGGIS